MIVALFNESTEYQVEGKTKIAYDNKVKQYDLHWNELVDMLISEPVINDAKIAVGMLSGWEYLPPLQAHELKHGHTRKVLANLVQNWLVIVDFDDAIFMSDFMDKYSAFEYVMYSSFSHNTNLNYDKFRVVMPLSKPVPVGEWNRMDEGLLEYFKGCDKTSFGQNRSFFLPHTTPAGRGDYVVWHNKGKWFDAGIIPLTEEMVFAPVVKNINSSKSGTGKILWETLDVVGLFQNRGMYIEKDARNRHLVHCPWENEHTSDTSGTAVWDASGLRHAGFNCIHHHCKGKKLFDVKQFFGMEIVAEFCEREELDIDQHKEQARALIQRTKDKLNHDRNNN